MDEFEAPKPFVLREEKIKQIAIRLSCWSKDGRNKPEDHYEELGDMSDEELDIFFEASAGLFVLEGMLSSIEDEYLCRAEQKGRLEEARKELDEERRRIRKKRSRKTDVEGKKEER